MENLSPTAAVPARTRRRAGGGADAAPTALPSAYRMLCEVALVGTLFLLYRQTRVWARGDVSNAMDNARHIVRIERTLGIFNEAGVQRLTMHSHALVGFLNRYYVTVHFIATSVFLAWVYVLHHAHYRAARFAFASVTAVGLLLHIAYPLAPPRMLSHEGFIDTLREFGPRIYTVDPSRSVANQFAAMPSLHFGWALMVGVGVVWILRSRWRWLAMVHPAITLYAIVATANHYWADALVAAALVGGAALALVTLLPRLLPGHDVIDLTVADVVGGEATDGGLVEDHAIDRDRLGGTAGTSVPTSAPHASPAPVRCNTRPCGAAPDTRTHHRPGRRDPLGRRRRRDPSAVGGGGPPHG